jgi:N-methylhydantoinase B
VLLTGGGGGYGSPLERDAEQVRADVLAGYVSIEAARTDYGVVIDPGSLEIDRAATQRTRGGNHG